MEKRVQISLFHRILSSTTWIVTFVFVSCICAGLPTGFSLWSNALIRDLHYTSSQVSTMSITAQLATYLPVPIIGILCEKAPLRLVQALGAGVLSLGSAGAAGAVHLRTVSGPANTTYILIMAAILTMGIGASLLYIAALTLCAKMFEKHRNVGVLMAIPVTSYGLSGFVSAVLVKAFFKNARTYRPELLPYFTFFTILSMTVAVVGAISWWAVSTETALIIHEEAADPEERARLIESEDSYHTFPELTEEVEEVLSQEDSTLKVLKAFVTDKVMWQLFIAFVLGSGVCECFQNNIGSLLMTFDPAYEKSTPTDDLVAQTPQSNLLDPALQVAIFSTSSTISRLLSGGLSDYCKGHILNRATLLAGSMALCGAAFALIAAGPEDHMEIPFMISTATIGVSYGTMFTLTPILVSRAWGASSFSVRWSIMDTAPGLGAGIFGMLYSTLSAMAAGDYGLQCYGWACYGTSTLVMAGTSLVAAGLVLLCHFGYNGWMARGSSV